MVERYKLYQKASILSTIARQVNFVIIPTMITRPQLSPANRCINIPLGRADCSRCADLCPAQAITLLSDGAPQLDGEACTGCTACLPVCPVDGWHLAELDPVAMVSAAAKVAATGNRSLRVACSGVPDAAADLLLPCHAGWDSLLLAAVAGEGVQTLHLIGLSACVTCPRRYGAMIMQQTERDYTLLNKALGVQLTIIHAVETPCIADVPSDSDEPTRRVFFRNLLPSLAQSMATTAMQIGHATRYAPELGESADAMVVADTPSLLPLRLRLFIRALPKLRVNFTPLPLMPSLPLGAIQVDTACTACGGCVEVCPTDALQLKPFGAKVILEFKADCCIGCRYCIIHCPEQAITQLPSISLPAIAAHRSRPLIMVNANSHTATPT